MTPEQIQQFVRQEIQKSASANRFQLSGITRHLHNGTDAPKVSQNNIEPGVRALGSLTLASDGATYQLVSKFNPTSVRFTGVATRTTYTFTVTAANATIGAVYTNNGNSFTVLATITGTTTLTMRGALALAPSASGTLTKSSGTGDATITFASVTHAIDARAHVIGEALVGPSFNYQPLNNRAVQPGSIHQITQGSSMFLIDSNTSPVTVRAIADEFHIVETEYAADPFALAGGVVARATVGTIQTVTTGTGTQYVVSAVTMQDTGVVLITVSLAPGWQIDGTFIVT